MPGSKKHAKACTTLGTMPAGTSYVTRLARAYQRGLEAAVRAAHGDEISFVQASAINAAARAERAALMVQYWLRKGADKLTATEKLQFNRELWEFTGRRERCVQQLRLGGLTGGEKKPGTGSIWDALDRADDADTTEGDES